MKETQEILKAMGFVNTHDDVWKADWFGVMFLLPTATPEDLAMFIYNRGRNTKDIKKYTCTDCHKVNYVIDNKAVRVGFCANCGHPLWNPADNAATIPVR